MKQFDLNIGKVLAHWTIPEALREIISNAIDEEKLGFAKQSLQIYKEDKTWKIRDFGRGIKIKHFIFTENEEKIEHNETTGKFGFGLKDALGVLFRHGIKVSIRSPHGNIKFQFTNKTDFDEIETLHALLDTNFVNPEFEGTEFSFLYLEDVYIYSAKKYFLRYTQEPIVEEVRELSRRITWGQILEKTDMYAHIYFNGVKVATEEKFMFSYNITHITEATQRKLNRERQHVPREVYKDAVESMLLNAQTKNFQTRLAQKLRDTDTKSLPDEISKWKKVKVYAIRIQNSLQKTLFFTPEEYMFSYNLINDAINDGYYTVQIDTATAKLLPPITDIDGQTIITVEEYERILAANLQFDELRPEEFTAQEAAVFAATTRILDAIGGKPPIIQAIKVAQYIRPHANSDKTPHNFPNLSSYWDKSRHILVIYRNELSSVKDYAYTLLQLVALIQSDAKPGTIEYHLELLVLLKQLCKYSFP